MNETLSPRGAEQAIFEARRWDKALARRTEGLTWFVWGLAVPGLLLTMGFVGQANLPGWTMFAVLPAWVAAGFAFTSLLWTTARLTKPDLARPGWGAYLLRVIIIAAAILMLHFVVKPTGMAWPLGLMGAGWMAVGMFTRRLTPSGRASAVAIGGTIAAAAVVLALLDLGDAAGMLYAAAAAGIAPMAAGIWQTTKG